MGVPDVDQMTEETIQLCAGDIEMMERNYDLLQDQNSQNRKRKLELNSSGEQPPRKMREALAMGVGHRNAFQY